MRTDTSSASALFQSDDAGTVGLQIDGQPLFAPAGTNLAAALLLNGVHPFRTTPVSGSPRAPYCMMGVCFDCLVEVDGVPARQACLTPVREGMCVRRQQGAPTLVPAQEGDQHGR